jgi:biopolymer transport protein ExbD
MRRFSERSGLQTLSELNVTPLLDLAFVLLIIFMITTPLMENKVDLVVPTSQASKSAVNPDAVQTIEINRAAELKFNGATTTLAQLEDRLNELRRTRPEIGVIIRSHKELPVQNLVDLMDVMQRAQITKVGVVTVSER